MKRVMILAVVFIVLVVVLLVYLGLSRQKDTGKLVLSGIVEAKEYNYSFRIAGQLESIFYQTGNLIDSGEVMAELDSGELAKAKDQAEKSFQAAKAGINQLEVSLETVTRNLEKVRQLIPSGAAAQSQYDDLYDQKRQIEAQLVHSRKNLEALKATVELADIRLDYARLISTKSGTVLDRMYEVGEVVMAGSPVVTIADLENLEIRVYLPEISLGKIKLGQDVNIQIDSHPDEMFPGSVKYISDKAEFTPKNVQTKEERIKQVFAVDIAANSQGGILKPGMPCDVIVHLE